MYVFDVVSRLDGGFSEPQKVAKRVDTHTREN
jgi:hypothetical protein